MKKMFLIDKINEGYLLADENFKSFYKIDESSVNFSPPKVFQFINKEDTSFFSYNPLSTYQNIDVNIIGVPYSLGTNKANSTVHLFPKILREKSLQYPVYNRIDKPVSSGLYDINANEKLFEGLVFEDLGDTQENDEEFRGLQEGIEFSISNKSIPLLIGGDHSITYKSILSIVEIVNRPILIIDFDAHHDCGTSFTLERKVHHGNFIRHLLNNENVIGAIQVGGRGIRSLSQIYKHEKLLQIPSISMNPNSLRNAIDIFMKKNPEALIYLSFDMDCLDLSNFNHVDFPVHNGPSWSLLIGTLKAAFDTEYPVIATDLVEGNHHINPKEQGSYMAALQILSYILNGIKINKGNRRVENGDCEYEYTMG